MAYRHANKYRKLWEQTYGPIPTDNRGRSFDIHHIDGDKHNNNITNLKCVSIEEHYQIHLDQGDHEACHAISLRMGIEPLKGWHHSKETINKLSKPKKSKENYKKSEEHRKKIGDANRGKKLPPRSEAWKLNLKKPKSEDFKKKVSQTMKGVSKKLEKCPHCSKVGGVNIMKRFHFNNCKSIKEDPPIQQKVKCPYCLKEGGISNMKRYHFENCKTKNK
jgi:hypothetical protein